ncbi:MAG: outer membrane protein transport protein, partial [Kiloniellales bacterium]|nr:outer membrane protein transport protein [Kiloniellales bacterium]
GVHFRPVEDWLLQAGFSYDTSPVSDRDRTADMPIDRQMRFAVGVQHQMSQSMTLGGSFEFIDLGDGKIDGDTLRGDYQDNYALFVAVNASWKF